MNKSTDVRTPGIQAIAKKWNMSVSEVMRLVNDGAKVEKEHTKSMAKARQVARDHIAERPDYYKKLHKMEKSPISMKEDTSTVGVRGLGNVTGNPAIDPVNQYITTNTMSYEDYNGAVLKLIRDKHNKHLNDMGFTSYSPNEIQHSTNKMNLKELGEYDNKGGTVGAEGLSDAPKKQVNEISAELVGKVSNARFWRGEAPSKTLTRAINKKFIESGKKKEEKKEVKEFWMPFFQKHHVHSARLSKKLGNKPDLIVDRGGEKGQTKYGQQFKEETKMSNGLIKEAIENIAENNLPEMKDNLMKALQEKAMEKLEERKKEIAANYFAE